MPESITFRVVINEGLSVREDEFRRRAVNGAWVAAPSFVHSYSPFTAAQWGQTSSSEDLLAESVERKRFSEKQSDLGVRVSAHTLLRLVLLCNV